MKEIVKRIEFDTAGADSISPPEEMLLFDIETTGLKKETTQIYLIGCGYFENPGELTVVQWLTESASDEPLVLDKFTELAASKKTLVHFNGDRFDIPYVSYKLDYYGMDFSFDTLKSTDIYKCIKPYKNFFGMERMNQKSVEDFLGIERKDKYNGGELIHYYYRFEMTGDPQAQELIMLHNFEDVLGMAEMLPVMNYPAVFEGEFDFVSFDITGTPQTAVLEYELRRPLPKDVTYEKDGIAVFAGGSLLQISVSVYEGEVKVPVPDVENYYYLPVEDMVVHRDVAEFVDKKYRKKATSKNCFLKKKGCFLQTVNMTDDPDYLMPQIKGKPIHYIDLAKFGSGDEELYKKYAADILKSL